MDKREAVNLVRRYSEVVRKHFAVDKVVLFGSYASGRQRKDSDIDVAVVVRDLQDDFLTSATELWSLTDDIDVRIEPIILDPSHDRSGFLEHILETGEVIYSRDA